MLSFRLPLRVSNNFFCQSFGMKYFVHTMFTPYMLHVPPLLFSLIWRTPLSSVMKHMKEGKRYSFFAEILLEECQWKKSWSCHKLHNSSSVFSCRSAIQSVGVTIQSTKKNERAMAQAVSGRTLTAEALFQSRASPCEICGSRSGSGVCFSPSTSAFLCQYHCINAAY